MGEAVLYGIPGSHAVRTGELMLEHKRIEYRRRNFPPGLHRVMVRVLLRFPGDRVPAVRFADGSRGQGTQSLARVLDEKVREPRLVPDDPRVEEAERWGNDVLQEWARRMVASAGARNPDLLAGRGGEGRMGWLLNKREFNRGITCRVVLRAVGATRERLEEDETLVDEMLDTVDAYIAEGVLNGPQLNCADFQIATSLALLEYRVDHRPKFEGRPAQALLDRVLPA